MESILPARLKAGSPGLGEASQTDIERRAAELAHSDGRGAFTAADLGHAAAELAGGASAREANPAQQQLAAWDDPLEQSGHRVESAPPEDERSIAEQLIQDGIAEADHDLRVAAEDGKKSGSTNQ